MWADGINLVYVSIMVEKKCTPDFILFWLPAVQKGPFVWSIGWCKRDWEIAVTITPMKPVVQARLGNRGYNNPHEDGLFDLY